MAEGKSSNFNKIAKRLLIGGALLAVAHSCAAPEDRELDPAEDYKPNAVQQEFLRLAAAHYDYVALGDTDHSTAEISMFAMDTDTVGALAAGGKTALFLEDGPYRQIYFDAVRDIPEYVAELPADSRYAAGNMWLCNAESKVRLNENFEESLQRNSTIEFLAADQRHSDEGQEALGLSHVLLFGLPLALYETVYGCVDTPAFIPGAIFSAITGVGDDSFDRLTDDTLTARFIEERSGGKGGAIFYGAGHFDRDDVNGKSMVQIFEAAGRSVAVINVHIDVEHSVSSSLYELGQDAIILIDNDNDPQHGIRIENPEMQPLYMQAVRNVQARNMPGPAAP